MKPLLRLRDYGQSYWLDNLSRTMITGGELERRVKEQGLRGVTSNPAIFYKAIQHHDYDADLARLSGEGRTAPEIYEAITTADVRSACDVLRPVYDRSEGRDGFVSLEVSPHLARDTEGTIAEAHRLWATVDRPNLMIKVPGTREGVPAVERLLTDGLNVNVTLLFAIDHYEAVAAAYVHALENRAQAGKSLHDVASVASFFLSRIDSAVDAELEAQVDPESQSQASDPRPVELLGRAAVANAKLAYRSFRNLLESERWQRLAEAGAHPQRMLWASTSTKNPHYRDVMYVEPLIGPDTVNTMPDATASAFGDHGMVSETIFDDMQQAEEVMEALGQMGIDLRRITDELEEDGIRKFVEPFDQTIRLIESKTKGS